MIIGVDFDNTIVRWDELFYEAAVQKKLIPNHLTQTKGKVRDYLRQIGNEDTWTELQGHVYGALAKKAPMFDGVREFFMNCRERGIQIFIISHKTRFPFLGKQVDLHQAAHDWLEQHGFYDPNQIGLSRSQVFFELTKQDKLNRIKQLECTHFIDDLPEFLLEPQFPSGVEKILFDPNHHYADDTRYRRVKSWSEIARALFARVLFGKNWKFFSESASNISSPLMGEDKGGGKVYIETPHPALPPQGGKGKNAVIAIASSLLKQTDLSIDASSIQQLTGGANNRIFRIGQDNHQVLLKIYFRHPEDPRDRLNAEFSFSHFAWDNGIRVIAKPIASDSKHHSALYEFIQGHRLSPNEISRERVLEALNFYLELNRFRLSSEAKKVSLASEACFSIKEHLQCVEKRINALKTLSSSPDTNRDVSAFIQNELYPAWQNVIEQTRNRCDELGLSLNEELKIEDRRVSPSDFGFHNALLEDTGKLRFIDFEYAGWDDPAKMVCDFFCQPALPVSFEYFKMLAEGVASGMTQPELQMKRMTLLLPVYQIKWCCILLNDFVPVGRARRDFAHVRKIQTEQSLNQLDKARKILSSYALH